MLAAGATPIIGTHTAAAGAPGQGSITLFGAFTLSDRTSVDVLENRKVTCPAMTVPTQVP